MSQTYDAFDEAESQSASKPSKPLWKLLKDKASDDEVFKWLTGEKSYLVQENRERQQRIQRNIARYKGIMYLSQQIREAVRDVQNDIYARKVQKIVVNHAFDLVRTKTARQVKYRPAVAILPTKDELQAKVGSKMTKALLDHIWYTQKYDGILQSQFHKVVNVMGEAYLPILWDKCAGGIDPDYKPYADDIDAGKTVTLKNEAGEAEKGEDGEDITIDSPMYNGDVTYGIWLPLNVNLEKVPSGQFSKVRYMFVDEAVDLWEARATYKDKDKFFPEDDAAQVFDVEKMEMKSFPGYTAITHVYHKAIPGLLPKGAHLVFTSKGLVLREELGYDHGNLPCTRRTDLDIDGDIYGHSGLENVAGLIGAYNNLTNSTIENLVMCGRPKWAYPAGSVRKETLGNAITMVEFKGPTPPQLLTMNPTPPESYQLRGELRTEFREIYGSGVVSRGEAPKGVKAGVALQYLGEQEAEVSNEDVLKTNEWIKETAIMTIHVAAEKYADDDKRLVRFLGKNNIWMSVFFETKWLRHDFDIRVQNTSALPTSKSARMQTLFDLNEQFPDRVSPDQVLEMLDFAQEEKFYDVTTRSVRAAQAENEQMMEARDEKSGEVPIVADPKEYEDHLAHWREHVGQMREWSFKYQTPAANQKIVSDHVMATEMLMYQKAKENPLYQEKLAALEGFPVLFKIPELAPANSGTSDPSAEPQIPTELLDQMAGAMGGPEAYAEQGGPIDLKGETQREPVPSLDAQSMGTEPGQPNPIPPSSGI